MGGQVADRSGERVGRLVDVVARLRHVPDGYPAVSGLVVRIGGRELWVSVDQVASLSCDGITLASERVGLGRFERRPGEVLLGQDLAARHLIHLSGARLVRANDIELAKTDGRWLVVAVDISSKPVLRRLLPRGLRNKVRSGTLVDWSDIEPFVAHVPTAHLRIPFRKLAKLHPAQLADIVEAASHDEGEEIIEAVGQDLELQADVFEELDPDHQAEFLQSRSDEEAAHLLARMEPDDAADLLMELDQERRLPILERLPAVAQGKLKRLLRYNPETAGGLMNPDVISVPATATAETALQRVRDATTPGGASTVVFVSADGGTLQGVAPLVDLIRADPKATLSAVARPDPVVVHPEADLHKIIRRMSDYNLSVVPVVDSDGRLLGQITVDDVLELLLPEGWRRQYGMSTTE